MARKNRSSTPSVLERRLRALSEGTRTVLGGVPTIVVGGVSMTPAAAAARFDAFIALFVAPNELHASYSKAIYDRDAAKPAMLVFARDYEDAVRTQLGRYSPDLEKFGLTPAKKRAERSSAEKAESAEKGALTRVLRGTKGSRQKKAIKATSTQVAKPARPCGKNGSRAE